MPLSAQSLSRTGLRDIALATLLAAATDAGTRVFDPSTLPEKLTDFPALIVSAPSERKDTNGSGAPQFFSTIMLAVMGRVQGTDQGATEQALDALVDQVEIALLCGEAMVASVQRFVFVETHLVVNAGGETFVGEATVIVGCEVWQLYEPGGGVPIASYEIDTAFSSQDAPPRPGPVIITTAAPQ